MGAAFLKTTIDIPDALYRRAKIRAVEAGTSFRENPPAGAKP